MVVWLRSVIAVAGLALLVAPAAAETKKYPLDSKNTKIEFVGAKEDGTHTGGFEKLAGHLSVDGTDAATMQIAVTIDINSMHSDDDKLTAHLKAPDFFDAKRFPEAKFVSTAVKPSKEGYNVTGDLTMHGETHSVTFPAKVAVTPAGAELTAKFSIDRNKWGISYGKGKIKDAVDLSISLKTTK